MTDGLIDAIAVDWPVDIVVLARLAEVVCHLPVSFMIIIARDIR